MYTLAPSDLHLSVDDLDDLDDLSGAGLIQVDSLSKLEETLQARKEVAIFILNPASNEADVFDWALRIRECEMFKDSPLLIILPSHYLHDLPARLVKLGRVDLMRVPVAQDVLRRRIQFILSLQLEILALRKFKEAASHDLEQCIDAVPRLKQSFLSNISHELRTPLNAILTLVKPICDEKASEGDRVNYMEIVQRSETEFLRIMDNILTHAAMEANKFMPTKCRCSLSFLLAEVQIAFEKIARDKHIFFEFQFKPTLRTTKTFSGTEIIETEPSRLKRILSSVIDNAIKFTQPGGRVSVTVNYQPFSDTHPEIGALSVTVEDTGVGMDPSTREHLFEAFNPLDSSLKRHFNGLGLSLYLCRRLAQTLQGKVELLSSAIGEGSRFVVDIPILVCEFL
jgi:signal transduction histidine kinase